MNEKLEKILMKQSKENLIKYIELLFSTIDELEYKNSELKDELKFYTYGEEVEHEKRRSN